MERGASQRRAPLCLHVGRAGGDDEDNCSERYKRSAVHNISGLFSVKCLCKDQAENRSCVERGRLASVDRFYGTQLSAGEGFFNGKSVSYRIYWKLHEYMPPSRFIGRMILSLRRGGFWNSSMTDHRQFAQEHWLSAQMLEALSSGIVLVDALLPDMPIIYVNTTFEKMTGYSRDEVHGRNCRFLQREDRQQPALETLRQALHEQKDASVTLRNYRKDGSLFHNELRISPIRDHQGGVTHYVGILHDITERVRTEEILEDYVLRYQALFGSAFNAVYLHDLQGNFVDANDTALTMFGCERSEIRSLTIASLLEPDDLPHAQANLRKIVETGAQDSPAIYKVRTRRGELIYVEATASLIYRHGKPWLIQGIARDITRQQQLEASLRENERRLRATIESSPDLIFRVHRDGTHLDYHAPSDDLLAVSPEEFLGKKITDVLAPEMANTLMRLYQEVLDNQRMVVYEYELAVISGLRQFEARIVPSGEDETVTFVRDVTALRQAEKQAIELALEQERMRLLTEFIRTASHEFLTPLAIINSSADLILRIEDPDHRREKVSQITQQVSHVSKLVEMLLTVVTLETLRPDKNPIDLPDLVGGLCIEMRTLAEVGDRLRSTIALDLPVVNGYPAHLRMAIRNLIE
ncbi:PAS domain S-box protein, partial [Anaerolineae bacterium CFX9]|nr:PAS domain S-box protein [Anaerolineae bacterium CFX9]